MGDCLYPDWHAAYFIPFITRNNAIVVTPNYRLTPEHPGAEIVQDLRDFWTWFHGGGVEKFLNANTPDKNIDIDYSRLLVAGESAGGYMALMSGLTQPKGVIKAILAQYPMTEYFRRGPESPDPDMPVPPSSAIDAHMASVTPGTVVSSAIPPFRGDLISALSTHDRYLEFFGDDKALWPVHLVEQKDWLPPTWIIHGDKDRIVAVQDSQAFVEKAKRLEGVQLLFSVREGQDHGFDVAAKEDEEEWLKEGLTWVEERWLA